MNKQARRVNRFLKDFTGWASTQSNIQAIALVGSYARGTAIDSSDVDLVMVTCHRDYYLEQTHWLTQFGEIKRQQIEDYGKVASIRIWYTSGLEVEYGITNEDWVSLPLDEGTRQVIQDGMVVLFERSTLLSLARGQVN